MSNINDSDRVKAQYSSAKNLSARVRLHQLYSTNKQGWTNWVFAHYNLRPGQAVLELGCGNGGIWKANLSKISGDVHLVLTDLSEGMLSAARENLPGLECVEYKVMDAQDIAYSDGVFDVVIANHMLYHVPDRRRALSEVARVLKPDGVFLATTVGAHNMAELGTILQGFDVRVYSPQVRVFTLENGGEQLAEFFGHVETEHYIDSLHITEAQPLVDYVLSLGGISDVVGIIDAERVPAFADYVAELLAREGYIDINKEGGIFIATNPRKE